MNSLMKKKNEVMARMSELNLHFNENAGKKKTK